MFKVLSVIALLAVTGCCSTDMQSVTENLGKPASSVTVADVRVAASEWDAATEGKCSPDVPKINVREVSAEECEYIVGSKCLGFYDVDTDVLALVTSGIRSDEMLHR